MPTMTFHPATHLGLTDLLARARELLALWRRRSEERAEFARMTDRDLREAGLCRASVACELRKPFWRG